MVKRLLAFGCSHTYGQALFDSYLNEKEGICLASKFAWPNILAQKLNKTCVNLSVEGASNKQICYKILNTNFSYEDYVFILWTYSSRTCVLQDELNVKHLSVQIKKDKKNVHLNKESEIYYRNFFTEYDSIINDYFYFNLANLYLEKLNLDTVVNLLVTDEQIHNHFMPLKWNKVKFLDFYFEDFRSKYPKASDGGHLGEEGHIVYANKIFDKLFIKKDNTKC